MMKFNIRFALPLLALLTLAECRQKENGIRNEGASDPARVLAADQNDTIPLRFLTPGLASWLEYYGEKDSSFLLRNFRASGVLLHMDEMPEAISKGNEDLYREWFDYSPDSSYYLDLVSYNNLIENGRLLPGEADQQVTLCDRRRNIRKQLMFLGPSQLAEFADWTGDNSFIIGLTSCTERGDSIQAEIFFFSLPDTAYTNFRLTHKLPLQDNLSKNGQGFSEYFLSRKKQSPHNP